MLTSVTPSKSLPSPSVMRTPDDTTPVGEMVLNGADEIPSPLGMAKFVLISLAYLYPFASDLRVTITLAPELVTVQTAAIAVFAANPAASAAATSVAVLLAVVSGTTTVSGDPVTGGLVNVNEQLPLEVAPLAAVTVAVTTCAVPATYAADPVATPDCRSSVTVPAEATIS